MVNVFRFTYVSDLRSLHFKNESVAFAGVKVDIVWWIILMLPVPEDNTVAGPWVKSHE